MCFLCRIDNMGDFTQLIDFQGNFGPSPVAWLKEEGFTQQGFDYSVVTVLGCQSSGKSTLLNALFGTRFPVMDASKGRQQTTKGLWLGRDQGSNTLVLDVEGTDSKERGEDRLTFEHRAALFSLALADCVIVNMWYHDLGRYTASNYGLLKTVLGVNLELFQQQTDAPKTTMIFVIRDYNEKLTPLDKLTEMIEDDIRQLWKETVKPDIYKESVADHFFTFQTVGLPSKIERPDSFLSACTAFRDRWLNEWRPETYSRQIPADGFAFYVQSVWETILRSSELNIPSQKEMLATYRCEEIKAEALSAILPEVKQLLDAVQEGTLASDQLLLAVGLVKKALELYDAAASRYQPSVFSKKRGQLVQALQRELQKVVDVHLTRVRHTLATEASTQLRSAFPDSITQQQLLDSCVNFKTITADWKHNTLEKLESVVKTLQLDPAVDDEDIQRYLRLDSTHAKEALEEGLDAMVLRARERQDQGLQKEVAQFASSVLGNLDTLLHSTDLTPACFWKSVTKTIPGARDAIHQKMYTAYAGLSAVEPPETPTAEWDAYVLDTIVRDICEKLKRICDWLPHYVFARFQRFFNQDEQDVPRQWQNMSSDQIKEVYVAARDQALVILDLFADIEAHTEDLKHENKEYSKDLSDRLTLSDAKKEQILAKAQRQMLTACQEAQLLQTTGGRATRIPWWMWVLLLAFGYNEISVVLFSPVTLILLVVAGLVLLLSYYTNNLSLPLDLSRHMLSLIATALIPLLSSLQSPQGVSSPAPYYTPAASRPGPVTGPTESQHTEKPDNDSTT